MANPQLENGHTRISNELIEAVVYKITHSSWLKIILWTIRLTYGWGRKEVQSNYQSYATKLGVSKDTIKHTLLELNDRKILTFVALTKEQFVVSVNKNYELWKIE